jgi:2-hydroxychromene-2-carboxylate isomerase
MPPRELEFFFDIGSAYSYLAATQLDTLAARAGVGVRYRPFLLGAVFKASGNAMPARVPAKARWMLGDLARWGAHYGVPIRVPSRFPLDTLRTQRALAAVEGLAPAALPAMAQALFRAYWVEDQDVSADAVIAAAAAHAGSDADAVVAALGDQATKDRLRATTDEAVRRGAFGAPSLFVGDELFWGNDRLELLEAHLRATAG